MRKSNFDDIFLSFHRKCFCVLLIICFTLTDTAWLLMALRYANDTTKVEQVTVHTLSEPSATKL